MCLAILQLMPVSCVHMTDPALCLSQSPDVSDVPARLPMLSSGWLSATHYCRKLFSIANESVPKIIINNTIHLFFRL